MAGKHCAPKKRESKAYKPRRTLLNPMRVAMARVSVLTPDERRTIMVPTKAALERLRVGSCTQEDWGHLANAANIGLELSYLGICSDDESVQILSRMLLSLGGICRRVNAGGNYTPKGPELVAVSEGVDRHDIQLLYASCADLERAVKSFELSKQAARAGKLPSLSIAKKEVAA
jgi:hypothetical protein